MESFRSFLRSNSFRNTKKKNKQYLRTHSQPDQMHHLPFVDQSSSSSTKLQSLLSQHPSSIADLTVVSKPYFDLETCSGFSTPSIESLQSNSQIAANVSDYVRSFTHQSTNSDRYSTRERKYISQVNLRMNRLTH